MPAYRVYSLDGQGKIARAEELSAKSDEDAIMIVLGAKKHLACELWDRDRLVTTILPSSERT